MGKYILAIIALCISQLLLSNHTIDSLEKVVSTLPDDSNKIKNLLKLSQLAINESDGKLALKYSEQAFSIAKNSKNTSFLIRSQFSKGSAYFTLGEYSSAAHLFEISLDSAKNHNDTASIYDANNALSLTYRILGAYPLSMKFATQNLSLAEQQNKLRTISISSMNIGNILRMQEKYAEARNYFQKGLKYAKLDSNVTMAANILMGLANVYNDEKNWDSALYYYDCSIIEGRKINYIANESKCCHNMGLIYHKKGDFKKALAYYKLCDNYQKLLPSPDPYILSANDIEIGVIYDSLGNTSLAKTMFYQGLETAIKAGVKGNVSLAYKKLSGFYYKQSDYKNAYLFLSKYIVVDDSLQNEEIDKNTTALQLSYQSERDSIQLALKEAQLQKGTAELIASKTWNAIMASISYSFFLIFILVIINSYLKRKVNASKWIFHPSKRVAWLTTISLAALILIFNLILPSQTHKDYKTLLEILVLITPIVIEVFFKPIE